MDESGGYQVTLNATFFQHFSENYNATTHGTTCLRIYIYTKNLQLLYYLVCLFAIPALFIVSCKRREREKRGRENESNRERTRFYESFVMLLLLNIYNTLTEG